MENALSGTIQPKILYTFEAIEKQLGVKKAAIRKARENGLEVRYWGRKGYVLGQSLIDHILTKGKKDRGE